MDFMHFLVVLKILAYVACHHIFQHCPKYCVWIILLACSLVPNLPNFLENTIWFVLGIIGCNIVTGSSIDSIEKNLLMSCVTPPPVNYNSASITNDYNTGWMLTSESYYPATHSVTSTKVGFVKISGNNLKISFPHSSKNKRLIESFQNDLVIDNNTKFVQHEVYNLLGAKIETLPAGLSRKRIWSKKFPILITLKCQNYTAQFTRDTYAKKLYVFARSDREKENWFRHLISASKLTNRSTAAGCHWLPLDISPFLIFMKKACPNLLVATPFGANTSSFHRLQPSFFVNAFIARGFYDVLNSTYWRTKIHSKINRKMRVFSKRPFIDSISLKKLDLGICAPVLTKAGAPFLDSQGLWVDLEMEYPGTIIITLEIHINLNKLGTSENFQEDMVNDNDSSSDSDDMERTSNSQLLKYAGSVVQLPIMKNKHVEKVVEKVAAIPLQLTVEIRRVSGVLAINMPPVPSDRIWIGFRDMPNIELKIRPKFGEWQLNFGFSWFKGQIKRRILMEFQRRMVLPNMRNIILEMMEFSLPK